MPSSPTGRRRPRRYRMALREQARQRGRKRILQAARSILAAEGIPEFTMDAIARRAQVTRQTVHNQFGTRTQLLETLFDQLAGEGGMEGMPSAFQQPDPRQVLNAVIHVFARFWTRHRILTRRIHGLAAVDPELEAVLEARNQRRRYAAIHIIQRLQRESGVPTDANIAAANDLFYAATSFEFFDLLAGPRRTPEEVAQQVAKLILSVIESALPNEPNR